MTLSGPHLWVKIRRLSGSLPYRQAYEFDKELAGPTTLGEIAERGRRETITIRAPTLGTIAAVTSFMSRPRIGRTPESDKRGSTHLAPSAPAGAPLRLAALGWG